MKLHNEKIKHQEWYTLTEIDGHILKVGNEVIKDLISDLLNGIRCLLLQ